MQMGTREEMFWFVGESGDDHKFSKHFYLIFEPTLNSITLHPLTETTNGPH